MLDWIAFLNENHLINMAIQLRLPSSYDSENGLARDLPLGYEILFADHLSKSESLIHLLLYYLCSSLR